MSATPSTRTTTSTQAPSTKRMSTRKTSTPAMSTRIESIHTAPAHTAPAQPASIQAEPASRQDQTSSLAGKKCYHTPQLVHYGGIRALTATMGTEGGFDNAFMFAKTGGVQ